MKTTNAKTGYARPMPRNMRLVLIPIMLLLSAFLFLTAADVLISEILISVTRTETQARIIKKERLKSRTGERLYITYAFSVEDREFGRTRLFGLFPKATKTTREVFTSIPENGTIAVRYSSIVPRFSSPVNDPMKYDDFHLLVLGTLLFGFLGVNELRAVRKNEQS